MKPRGGVGGGSDRRLHRVVVHDWSVSVVGVTRRVMEMARSVLPALRVCSVIHIAGYGLNDETRNAEEWGADGLKSVMADGG